MMKNLYYLVKFMFVKKSYTFLLGTLLSFKNYRNYKVSLIFLASFLLFSYYLKILKDKYAPGLEWALSNPPKPHAFTSLPLQSAANNLFTNVIQYLAKTWVMRQVEAYLGKILTIFFKKFPF